MERDYSDDLAIATNSKSDKSDEIDKNNNSETSLIWRKERSSLDWRRENALTADKSKFVRNEGNWREQRNLNNEAPKQSGSQWRKDRKSRSNSKNYSHIDESKKYDDSDLKKLILSKENGDSFLLSLIPDSAGFMNLIHDKQNDSITICLMLEILAKITTFEKSQLLNQFIVIILPPQTSRRHFMTTQLILFTSNLQEYVKNENERQIYVDGIQNLLVFLKFLLSSMINYAFNTVKNILLPLSIQIEFINNQLQEERVFPDKIFEELKQLNTMIKDYELATEENNESSEKLVPVRAHLNDFRGTSVCPTVIDILRSDRPHLQKNIIKGSYDSVDHYLSIQFNLLHEDFIRPLREGIAEYGKLALNTLTPNQHLNVKKVGDVNVYNDVHIMSVLLDPIGLVYEAHFDTGPFKNYRWQSSKRLLIGSLICLSSNHFKTFYFASVAGKRNESDLKEGRFYLKFEFKHEYEIMMNMKPEITFTAIESPVFFEAYRHNLEILKTFYEDNFPFKEYIIGVKNEISAPSHLKMKTQYDLSAILLPFFAVTDDEINDEWTNIYQVRKDEIFCDEYQTRRQWSRNRGKLRFVDLNHFIREHFEQQKKTFYARLRSNYRRNNSIALLNDESWLSAKTDFGFNESQFLAFRAALTKEFVIIQGPPGTGKTYVGLRIVQALIENLIADPYRTIRFLTRGSDIKSSKILVVCYTNHALDQFLQGILSFCNDVVRIGGNTKNVLVEAYNLSSIRKEMRQNHNQTFPGGERDVYCMMEEIERDISRLEKIIKESTKIVLQKDLYNVVSLFYKEYDLKISSDALESIDSWLGYKREVKKINQDPLGSENNSEDKNENDDLDKAEAEYIENSRIISEDVDLKFSKKFKYQERFAIEYVAVEENDEAGFQFQNNKRKHKKRYFENELKQTVAMTEVEALQHTELQAMDRKDRLRLYKFWLSLLHNETNKKINIKRICYGYWVKQLKEIRDEQDRFIVNRRSIIAMTTTGAAKYHHLIEAVQPNILVVEEAAEVLEAHIITSLCKSTAHVILIGDHQQLRPNPAVYDLAKNFKLDVSLFERMVNNDLPYFSLKEQHRMHPNISTLLVPHIYSDLKDHPSVSEYSEIRGMPSNMLFINHNENEEKISDTMSHMNVYEAEFAVELANYLLMQGYKTTQITILTTYTGQLLQINQNIRSHRNQDLKKVRVSVVDNFQGEENDIIILSCVRSNDEGKIGFLETPNRINVALSRAKWALYCIGNFDCFCQRSELWNEIVKKVKDQQAFGNKFEFTCQNHPEVKTILNNVSDFAKMPAGGCLTPCEAILECSHLCASVCHIMDPVHKNEYKCTAQCEKICELEHQCSRICHWNEKDCGACQTIIEVNGKCGHKVEIECGYADDDVRVLEQCTSPCATRLACGHICKGTCGSCKQGRFHGKCYRNCERILSCGHRCKGKCSNNCVTCDDRECPDQCVKSSEMERKDFDLEVLEKMRHLEISESCMLNDVNDLRLVQPRHNATGQNNTVTSVEIRKRSLILNYSVKLSAFIDNLQGIYIPVSEFESAGIISKLKNRVIELRYYITKLDSISDDQSIHDIDNEFSLLEFVYKALKALMDYYKSKKTVKDVAVKVKSTLDIVLNAGPCSKEMLNTFEDHVKKVLNSDFVKTENCN